MQRLHACRVGLPKRQVIQRFKNVNQYLLKLLADVLPGEVIDNDRSDLLRNTDAVKFVDALLGLLEDVVARDKFALHA